MMSTQVREIGVHHPGFFSHPQRSEGPHRRSRTLGRLGGSSPPIAARNDTRELVGRTLRRASPRFVIPSGARDIT
jgi:hypothetical protein